MRKSEDSDQPVHQRSQSSFFGSSCLDSIYNTEFFILNLRLKPVTLSRLAWILPGRKTPKTGFVATRLKLDL